MLEHMNASYSHIYLKKVFFVPIAYYIEIESNRVCKSERFYNGKSVRYVCICKPFFIEWIINVLNT